MSEELVSLSIAERTEYGDVREDARDRFGVHGADDTLGRASATPTRVRSHDRGRP